MFAIPLAFTGGLLALMLTGNPIPAPSLIGFIILAGIVVNNGIVFVDYVNQLRSQGMDTKEALLRAGQDRLRPLLMTALTTSSPCSPCAFDPSAGAGHDALPTITTIGGLLYATVLTLYLVPALYGNAQKSRPSPWTQRMSLTMFCSSIFLPKRRQRLPAKEEGDPS